MSVLTARQILEKQPSELIKASMDFTNWLVGGEVIQSGYLSVIPTDISAGILNTYSASIECTVSSGVAGKNYRFDFIVWTTSGNTYEADGILKCRGI